jgi:hypothetical protein
MQVLSPAPGSRRHVMRRASLLAAVVVLLSGARACFLVPQARPIVFPEGKRFAFSIIDDTDMTTLARVRPIYAVLERFGIRTTKTVWVFDSNDLSNDTNSGDSLQNPDYLRFIVDLQNKGFEIALHGVRGGSSPRADTIRGLEEFRRQLGRYPRMFINHSLNQENLYWGRNVFAVAPLRWAGGAAIRHPFTGHEPASPYFWGDVAQRHIEYVRRYTFSDINLLNVNPSFPYQLADKPYVNYWFPTANGDRILEFDELLQPENVERLEREGGVCLVYAHLGAGSFNKEGGVDARFERRITELAARKGWYVPASQILDHLRLQPAWTGRLPFRERLRLDTMYLAGQLMPTLGR